MSLLDLTDAVIDKLAKAEALAWLLNCAKDYPDNIVAETTAVIADLIHYALKSPESRGNKFGNARTNAGNGRCNKARPDPQLLLTGTNKGHVADPRLIGSRHMKRTVQKVGGRRRCVVVFSSHPESLLTLGFDTFSLPNLGGQVSRCSKSGA